MTNQYLLQKSLKGLQKNSDNFVILRIIDANINRSMEGMRVCEEVTRFILDNQKLTAQIKRIRHRLQAGLHKLTKDKLYLLEKRNSLSDVGKKIHFKKRKRKDYRDIFFANIQRVKESLRVLEEFLKLMNKNISAKIKQLRYEVYDFEKKVAKSL